jgi:MFS superfamily sulfate permease-like transporter
VKKLDFSHLSKDLPAGLSVFLVALPLCLGIALASGAPLFAGLLAGIVGGTVVALLSGSEVSVSGPAAGLTVIVFDNIQKLGGYEPFLAAVMLAGFLQIGLGYIKAGRLSSFVPTSVISGMLVAIGIVIILKQIPHALGWDADYEGEFEFFQTDHRNTLSEIMEAMAHLSYGAIIISVSALALIIGWERLAKRGIAFFKNVPAGLGVVALGIAFNEFFKVAAPQFYLGYSPEHMVNVPPVRNMTELKSAFTFMDLGAFSNPQMYVAAITIALVASIESLLSLEAADKLDPQRRISSPNQELIAQGVGNALSGLIGGLPVTSVVVRTSTNVYSGAKTRLAAFAHGVLLLLVVAVGAQLINRIPLACLAALLLSVGYKLSKLEIFKKVYKQGKDQFIPFVVTILAIVFIDLLIGILIGLIVGIVYVIYTNNQSALSMVRDGQTVLITFKKDVSFLNKSRLREILANLKPGDYVFIDGVRAHFIDRDIFNTIEDFEQDAQYRDIKVELKGIIHRKISPRKSNAILQKTLAGQQSVG